MRPFQIDQRGPSKLTDEAQGETGDPLYYSLYSVSAPKEKGKDHARTSRALAVMPPSGFLSALLCVELCEV